MFIIILMLIVVIALFDLIKLSSLYRSNHLMLKVLVIWLFGLCYTVIGSQLAGISKVIK